MSSYYDAKHLSAIRQAERPHLLDVHETHGIVIDEAMQRVLDNLAMLQDRYSAMPPRLLSVIHRGFAYRGRNPLLKIASAAIRLGFRADLLLRGRGDAIPLIGKGLQFAFRVRLNLKPAGETDAPATEYGSGIGYASQIEDLAIAQRYKAWTDAAAHFATEEERIGTEYYFAIHNTAAFLNRSPAIRTLINFGACYGIVDHGIAVRCPQVTVYGVDRAKLVKDFNDIHFQAPNLEYVAEHIGDFIERSGDLSDAAFMFMRTAFLFPETFMVALAAQLARHRIGAMIGMEPVSYLLSERRLYEFSTDYRPSAHYRKGGMIHNYPYIARLAGLAVIEEKWLAPTVRHGDETDFNRRYCFIAVRHD